MSINDLDIITQNLSLKQQICELLMPDIRYFGTSSSGTLQGITKLPAKIAKLFESYPVGGVILFRENLQDLEEITQLTHDLQQNTQFGRLIGVDQEGGVVTRINGATEMPGNMALGALNKPEITMQSASIIAEELKALGINLNFAPVLDVNSNPNNPIVGVRSFGSSPELVATHGCAYIDGLDQHDIISCVKHFPGHGDTATDSHLGETYVFRTAVEIEKVDAYPFKAAIANNVDMIMTAHIIAPKLDNELIFSKKTQTKVATPATLSKPIMTTILRQNLGFNGIIASDALDMEAIAHYFDPVEATILALEAGVDLILMPIRIWNDDGIQKFIDYVNQIHHLCSKSETLTKRVFESCKRILSLKQAKLQPRLQKQQELALRLRQLPQIINTLASKQFEQQIAAEAITLYRNNKKTLPWASTAQDKILIISSNNTLGMQTIDTLEKLGYTETSLQLVNDDSVDSIIEQIELADKVLLLTYNLTKVDDKLNHIINRLNHFYKPYVILSCRNPYDIMYLKEVNTNVLVYGASGLDQTNYHLRSFTLNLNAAIHKIMTSTDIKQFNTHCPVDLEPKKKDPRGDW